MKAIMTLIGTVLVVFGIVVLSYNGYTYKDTYTLAGIYGILSSPISGGIALLIGIIILALSQR